MILILKSTTSQKTEIVGWSEDAVSFLLRHGAIPPKNGSECIFLVEDPSAVRFELRQAGII